MVSLHEGAALLFGVAYVSLCFHEELLYESFSQWQGSWSGMVLLLPYWIVVLVLILGIWAGSFA